MHVVLLGDSVLDNASYVHPGEPDVRTQLQALLGETDRVSLLAVDGDVIHDVPNTQLKRLPADATHLVISAGGNNLLGQIGMVSMGVATVAEALSVLQKMGSAFEDEYEQMLSAVLAPQLPVTVCTVYNPQENNPVTKQLYKTAIRFFDDIIVQCATRHGLPVIDLRIVCSEPVDFANPIEPSAIGGRKIARAIHTVLHTHDFNAGCTGIYT